MCKFDHVTSLFNQVSGITPEGCSTDFMDATSGGSLPQGWYNIDDIRIRKTMSWLR